MISPIFSESRKSRDYGRAIEAYQRCQRISEELKDNRGRSTDLYQIGYCLHNKPEPEWDEALKNYREALALRTAPEQAADRASTLHVIGYCLHNKPEPEWDEALKNYREALALRTAPEQAADRAEHLTCNRLLSAQQTRTRVGRSPQELSRGVGIAHRSRAGG